MVPPVRDARFVDLILRIFSRNSGLAPGTGLQSPETEAKICAVAISVGGRDRTSRIHIGCWRISRPHGQAWSVGLLAISPHAVVMRADPDPFIRSEILRDASGFFVRVTGRAARSEVLGTE